MNRIATGLFVIFALLGTLFFIGNLHAEVLSSEPAVEWSKTFGGSQNDIGLSVVQTSDGG